VLVMLISSNRAIMGEHINGRLAATLGWATTLLMAGAAITSFAVA
jgi:Mn2+/Fe2+ NRAMP family transporter